MRSDSKIASVSRRRFLARGASAATGLVVGFYAPKSTGFFARTLAESRDNIFAPNAFLRVRKGAKASTPGWRRSLRRSLTPTGLRSALNPRLRIGISTRICNSVRKAQVGATPSPTPMNSIVGQGLRRGPCWLLLR
jgi:hypothetical protein